MLEALPTDFFNFPPLGVARRLLGCRIVRLYEGNYLSGRIVEVEAYGGLRDPACYLIARDKRIWQLLSNTAGAVYLHRSYKFALLNITCDQPGSPGCVLIRAIEPTSGQGQMRLLRHGSRHLTNGPARLVEALAIDPAWEGQQLPLAHFWIEPAEPIPDEAVIQTVRIGLKRGRELPWRFALRDNAWVSRKLPQNLWIELA
ncbi:DNA-3-methyladenine glycosylase [Gloeobacter kilaueensis]|uniref:Putative 3-methyladenine DNA glycosylase n=1 Tax=Gloeobacter kilaueensis (strain ATCC BAA-2537 / CCAP 1431/1 / ULC 316 / JS1) TaxID=1183438 RepID=U5QMI9_GLOK1|nr:DNA-3-methyladenine glycosylase [Gloeobacter kilaueensis]AGY60141.1 3-methyladenine DNA glycosylase [Gloeobacter kilaueensis JS1]